MPLNEKKEKQNPLIIKWINEPPLSEDEYDQLKIQYSDYLESGGWEEAPFMELPRLIIQTMNILKNNFARLDISFQSLCRMVLNLSALNEKKINDLDNSYSSVFSDFDHHYGNLQKYIKRDPDFFKLIKSSQQLKSLYTVLIKNVSNKKQFEAHFVWIMGYRRNIIAYYNGFKLSYLQGKNKFGNQKVMRLRRAYVQKFVRFLRKNKSHGGSILEGILLRAACLYIIDQCFKFQDHKDDSVDQLCLSVIQLLRALQERIHEEDVQVPSEVVILFNPNCKKGRVDKKSDQVMKGWEEAINKRLVSRAEEKERKKRLDKEASEKANQMAMQLIKKEDEKHRILNEKESAESEIMAHELIKKAKSLGEGEKSALNNQCHTVESGKGGDKDTRCNYQKENGEADCTLVAAQSDSLKQPECLSELEDAINSVALYIKTLHKKQSTVDGVITVIKRCIEKKLICDEFIEHNPGNSLFKTAFDHIVRADSLQSQKPTDDQIFYFSELERKRILFWYSALCQYDDERLKLEIHEYFNLEENSAGKERSNPIFSQRTTVLSVIEIISCVANSCSKKAYVHGGFVRDLFQENEFNDVDIVTSLSVVELDLFFTLIALKGAVRTKVINGLKIFSFTVDGVEFDVTCKDNIASVDELYQSEDFYFNALYLEWCKTNGFVLHDPSGEGVFYAKVSCARLIPSALTRADPFLFLRILRFYFVKGYRHDEDQVEKLKGSACVNAFIGLGDNAESDQDTHERILRILAYIEQDYDSTNNAHAFLNQLIPSGKRNSPLVEKLYSTFCPVRVDSSSRYNSLFSYKGSGDDSYAQNKKCSSMICAESCFSMLSK